MKYHYLDQYIASSQHKITFNLIGAGGTGSHMLTNLAVLSHTMTKLGRQPFFVKVFDPDFVTDHNVGRQMFSPADIGRYKAEVLVNRCNRYFGTDWNAFPVMYGFDNINTGEDIGSNFIISCVDSVQSRKAIKKIVCGTDYRYKQGYNKTYYWMDIGNERSSGQVILGTVGNIKQPRGKNRINNLPDFFVEYKNVKENNNQPSCSVAEALFKQDLFINKILADNAAHMLWSLLRDFRINYRGMYVNLETIHTQPILL